MIINYNDTIKDLIDKYKKNSKQPLDFDEIRGITKIVLEHICHHENIWDDNDIDERTDVLNPLDKRIKLNIEKILKNTLEKTILNEETQKKILPPIAKEITSFITKNTIY